MRTVSKPGVKIFLLITLVVILCCASFMVYGGAQLKKTETPESMPIKMAAYELKDLDRAPVLFDHLKHTSALKSQLLDDCKACHATSRPAQDMGVSQVVDFGFPIKGTGEARADNPMLAYHAACVSCHEKKKQEGAKTGPAIGLCGECHVRRPSKIAADFKMDTIFNYMTHSKHVEALSKIKDPESLNVAGNVISEVDDPKRSSCKLCHHIADETGKKLLYKINTENACSTCHKQKDEKNIRSIKNVSHSACIGCHMKLRKRAKKVAPTSDPKAQAKLAKFGPFECQGCHGAKDTLTPTKIAQLPRLMRGQKDYVNISLKDPSTGRMKVAVFNHKAHEKQGQFCNSCHHYSLEKCSNCHTPLAEIKKSGGVTYEMAFHKINAKLSCVGCHEEAKTSKECAGCHYSASREIPKTSCPMCHTGPVNKDVQAQANTEAENTASNEANQDLLAKRDHKITIKGDKDELPEVVEIKALQKEFQPAKFPHKKIVLKLAKISNNSSLASTFHSRAGQESICSGCHHKSDPAASQKKKVPNCVSCHSKNRATNKNLGRPGILGAYHQQCIGCHQAMDQKPKSHECAKCHGEKGKPVTASLSE